MGFTSIWHWVIVLAVVVMLFGTKKLRNLGPDLGAAIRGFKQGIKEDKDTLSSKVEEEETSVPKAKTSESNHSG